MAVVLGAFVVLIFGWSVSGTLLGAAIGGTIFGVVMLFVETREAVPRAARLRRLPDSARIVTPRKSLWRPLLAAPVMLAFVWWAQEWGVGPLLVPGQMLGYAIAELIGAALITRWERKHGGEVVMRRDDDGDIDLYVTA